MESSVIYNIDNNRDNFLEVMAEMVLLCNEVMRRQSEKKSISSRESSSSSSSSSTASFSTSSAASLEKKKKKKKPIPTKPLSLEYIADRLDVDEPIFGYLIRSDPDKEADGGTSVNDSSSSLTTTCSAPTSTTAALPSTAGTSASAKGITAGRLQGFIHATTFTNWQRSFRWDSLHEDAYACDEDVMKGILTDLEGERLRDDAIVSPITGNKGELAREMQSSLRCGDPWNEGIVWPRIAEISLLGAIKCGKQLVSLMIDRLERIPASEKQNYDYVVLQATDNSVPFYESMGFVRVGAITKDEKGEEDSIPKNEKGFKSEIVSSPTFQYKCLNDERPIDVAQRHDVSVWDIMFLNKPLFPGLTTTSRMQKGTPFFVPDKTKTEEQAGSIQGTTHTRGFYIAEDDETCKVIGEKTGIDYRDLVKFNKSRLPGLTFYSKLQQGTQIKLDADNYIPYCHWSFPEDNLDTSCPSYMMARRLNRLKQFEPQKDEKIMTTLKEVGNQRYYYACMCVRHTYLLALTPLPHLYLYLRSRLPRSSLAKSSCPSLWPPTPPKNTRTTYFYPHQTPLQSICTAFLLTQLPTPVISEHEVTSRPLTPLSLRRDP